MASSGGTSKTVGGGPCTLARAKSGQLYISRPAACSSCSEVTFTPHALRRAKNLEAQRAIAASYCFGARCPSSDAVLDRMAM